jgi:hypothetical protein
VIRPALLSVLKDLANDTLAVWRPDQLLFQSVDSGDE